MQVYIFFLHVVFCIYHFYTHSLSVISHLPAALGDSDCWESICSKFLLKIAKQHITHIIMQYLPILQLFMHIYTLYFYSEDTLLTYLQLVSSGFPFLKQQHVSENPKMRIKQHFRRSTDCFSSVTLPPDKSHFYICCLCQRTTTTTQKQEKCFHRDDKGVLVGFCFSCDLFCLLCTKQFVRHDKLRFKYSVVLYIYILIYLFYI